MAAPISIIIPTLNAQDALGRSLVPLFDGVHQGVIREVIFSDGGSQDRTKEIADDLGAIFMSGPASRGAQIARGMTAAQGEWLLVLHADTVLPDDWVNLCMTHSTQFVDKVGYFDLAFDHGGFGARTVAKWVWLRSRLFGLPYGDQAIFIARHHLDGIGGYPDLPLMEDVALARMVSPHLRPLGGHVTTSAEKYRRHGWLKQGARNLIMLCRFLLGADPQRLYEAYYKQKR